MKIFDEKNNVIENPDMESGKLVQESNPVTFRYTITQHEQGHYETIAEYPNGGKDVEWVIDMPEEGAWIAYDDDDNEVETDIVIPDDAPHEVDIPMNYDFMRYTLFTEDELTERAKQKIQTEINLLKAKLSETDYIASKIAEGAATKEEYAEQIAQRQEWRDKINELEAELNY